MVVIGLTGGIASGKSTVSRMLNDLGAEIIDADELSKEVVRPGQPAMQRIAEEFGSAVLLPDGSLNRQAMGRLVFGDPAARHKLNQIIHPLVIGMVRDRLIMLRERGCRVAVVDAPLLLEAEMDFLVDQVWVVAVPEDIQVARAMKRDNLSEQAAMARIRSQMPLGEKVKRADRVIYNSGSLANTRRQVEMLWAGLVGCEG